MTTARRYRRWLIMALMVLVCGVGRPEAPPDAGGVFVFSHKQFLWTADGRLVEDIHHLYRPLSPETTDKFSDYRLTFRPADQRIGVVRAGIHQANGEFAGRDTTPSATDFRPADGCRSGRDARLWQQVVSLPAGMGQSVEIRWQRMTSGLTAGFSGVEYLQTEDPLEERKLYFYLPARTPFRFETVHEDASLAAVSRVKDQDVYAFRFGELPAIPRETATPPPEWSAGRLIYSTFPDWDTAAREFRESYWSQVANAPQTSAMVRELIAGLTDRRAMWQRILDFVHRRIRTDDIGLWTSGRRPLAADDVLAATCGDPKDKAMLLGAMLTAAGTPALPVFFQRSLVPVNPSVPAVEQFNGLCLLVTTEAGEPFLLDPLDPWAPPGWIPQGPGTRGLVVRQAAAALESLPSVSNASHMDTVVDVADDGTVRFTVRGVLRGFAARQARQQLAGADESSVAEWFRQAARRHFSRVRQLRLEVDGQDAFSPEVTFVHEFTAAGAATRQADVLVLVLPWSVSPFGDHFPRWPEESRQTPVFLGPPLTERWRHEIRLPSIREVLYTPSDEKAENAVYSLRRSCSVSASEPVIVLEAEIRTGELILPVADCPAARHRLQDFRAERNRLIMVRQPAAAPGPAGDQGKGRVEIP